MGLGPRQGRFIVKFPKSAPLTVCTNFTSFFVVDVYSPSHKVDRVLGFFSSRGAGPEGYRHSLAGEGVGGPVRTRGQTTE